MVKKTRIEVWELYYVAVCMIMLGFWLGYILGGSSSWAAKYAFRQEFIPNMAVILSSSGILFLLIKSILRLYRKSEISERRLKNLQKKVGGISFYFFVNVISFFSILYVMNGDYFADYKSKGNRKKIIKNI